MRLSNRQPFVPSTILERRRARGAALRYAEHGWHVTPGAYATGGRYACGRPGCPVTGCHPAIESWEDDASTDTARVLSWWRHRPYMVLLVTGWHLDVLEVPAELGSPLARTAHGPIAAGPDGRWMFLVAPQVPLVPQLAENPDVIRHGRGSWVPAPPSRTPAGPVQWVVSPDRTQWRLPAAETVQAMLVDALGRRRAPVVPRQTSTARRAA